MFHDALDYLAGLIPECRGILVVVIDAYQARPAEIAVRFLRFMALSGDSGRFIADIALIPAIYFYIGARIEDHHRHRRSSLRSAVRPAGPRYAPAGGSGRTIIADGWIYGKCAGRSMRSGIMLAAMIIHILPRCDRGEVPQGGLSCPPAAPPTYK